MFVKAGFMHRNISSPFSLYYANPECEMFSTAINVSQNITTFLIARDTTVFLQQPCSRISYAHNGRAC
jgi:hypothetical protein